MHGTAPKETSCKLLYSTLICLYGRGFLSTLSISTFSRASFNFLYNWKALVASWTATTLNPSVTNIISLLCLTMTCLRFYTVIQRIYALITYDQYVDTLSRFHQIIPHIPSSNWLPCWILWLNYIIFIRKRLVMAQNATMFSPEQICTELDQSSVNDIEYFSSVSVNSSELMGLTYTNQPCLSA